MASPYFDSANRQVDESKKGLLEAVATGGTAGKQAFDAAQAQAAQARQEALGRAAERSALYGVGGNDQTVLGAYDARMNQTAVNRSNFESGLAQTQASGESYLAKARASIPTLEAQNIGKATDAETKIKLAIESAKQKALAEQEKEQRTLQRQLDAEARAEARALAREGRAESRSNANDARNISADALLGAAKQQYDAAPGLQDSTGGKIMGGPRMYAGPANLAPGAQPAIRTSAPLTDLAAQLGQLYGVKADTIASLYSPSKQSALQNQMENLSPAQTKLVKDTIASSLATKYATKGVNYATAQSVINNVDFKAATEWISHGAIDPQTQQPMNRDQLEAWIRREFITKDNRNWTAEYNILVGEYLPSAPKE